MSASQNQRVVAQVDGRVQGVGFRAFVVQRAVSLDLAGSVRNLPSGGVEVIAEGPRPALESLVRELHVGPPLARVHSVSVAWHPPTGERHFRVRPT
ncbi:MAG: acylphosphatase [Hyphomicrobiales bacterium]